MGLIVLDPPEQVNGLSTLLSRYVVLLVSLQTKVKYRIDARVHDINQSKRIHFRGQFVASVMD